MRELSRSLSRRAPRYWASQPCRARPRPSCGRPVDPGGRRCGIPGDTVFVEPGSYAEPGIACPANPALTCGVAIAKDGISLIGLMHGRRQVGCRPVGAAPLKCAVCGTVMSWPNGKATASRTCPGTLADLAAAGRQKRPFCAAQPRRSHHRRSPHSRQGSARESEPGQSRACYLRCSHWTYRLPGFNGFSTE